MRQLLMLAVLLSSSLAAQDKQPCHFWQASNVAVFTAVGAVQFLDYRQTQRRIDQGWVEVNPLAQSRRARIGIKVSVVSIMILLSYAAHRGGWHKGEKVIPAIFGVAGGVGIMSSMR